MINIRVLKNSSLLKKYTRSTVIAREYIGTEMIVVLKGDVGVFKNYRKQNEEMIATIGPGDFFGETALLLEKSAPFTTVALSDVIALPINRLTAVSFIRDEPDMAYELMKAMCGRLDRVGAAYEKLSGRLWVDADSLPREPSAAVQPAKAPEAPPAPPVTAPSPAPAPACADAAPAAPSPTGSSLFPEGHGCYRLPLENEDRALMMEKSHTCPICKKEFKTMAVRTSKLVVDRVDSDMRSRYKGVEPLYYDVVTCPNCLYSAMSDMFNSPDYSKIEPLKELQGLKGEVESMFSAPVDAFSVFAGYYLALLCAPKCFAAHQMAAAKLLVKLGRVYQDCGDAKMEEQTAKRALDSYMYIYLNEKSTPAMDQQLCIIIGELNLKVNDLKNARDFFFKAKTNKEGTPLLKMQAENRLADIRGM